jgi:hypothetical protein
VVWASPAIAAEEPPCNPCGGVLVSHPESVLGEIAREPRLTDEARLFVAWTVSLDGSADPRHISAIRDAGADPWVRVLFRTPQPIGNHLDELEGELQRLAGLVKGTGGGLRIQAVWQPREGEIRPVDHAFLVKRAAVAVTGASAQTTFVAGPLDPDPESLRALYGEEVAAYVDVVALAPGDGLRAAAETLAELDPGKPVAVDALTWPVDNPSRSMALLAEAAAAGAEVVFFNTRGARDVGLGPLKTMANELVGEVSLAPTDAPRGVERAWAFVRADDLSLRVVAELPRDRQRVELLFDDRLLKSPVRVDPATGTTLVTAGSRRTATGLAVAFQSPGDVVLLRLERPTPEELDGFIDRIDVAGERQMPVEEILRRLQAFEDDQARRLDHYQATRTLHLRFNAVQGTFEASYRGDFFFRQGEGFDWVWKDFLVGGIKWRSKRLPKIPLFQPEKVASQPVEIRLRKDYNYRLRGTATVQGRDCWVIDFRPARGAEGRSLFQGTVWVDREVYARVRTQAIQVGLAGEVISNEEVANYAPIDGLGQPAGWSKESFVLPVRTVGQRTLSILSLTLPVELETELENISINGPEFDTDLEQALASNATMVRDTEEGLRYLKRGKDGERIVEVEPDTSRLFLLGGVFWDESVDFPIPLAGVNYLDLDFKNRGNQLNVFFAGAFLNASLSDPRLFGGRWNGVVSLSGVFFNRTDELYRDGVVVPEENVKGLTGSGWLQVGRPLGNFVKLDLRYQLRSNTYEAADETAEDFVLPQDTLTHTFRTDLTYTRAGYRLGLSGGVFSRSDWEFWGLPGNVEYDPDQKDYLRWQAVFTKTWWFSKYRNVAVRLEHLDGENLDRFSGYDFGLFGDSSVAGYQSGLVRAERADGIHLSGGVNWLDKLRFDIEADAVWAKNAATGLDNELLAGIGVGGSLTLPWQLVTDFEIGYAVAGPGKGSFAARIVFLRLFPER